MFDFTQPAYGRLRKIYAERTRTLVAWAGSGLSVPATLPTWPQLRESLTRQARGKAETLDLRDREHRHAQISSVETIRSHWQAFQRLSELLGPASFEAAIHELLTPPRDAQCPPTYLALWSLRIGGMLTLNLDRFAARAFAEAHASVVNEMTGRDAPRHASVFREDTPFIVNLHGTLNDSQSWVFTRSQVDRLLRDAAYRSFVDTLFKTRTVLFIGVSADDISAGGLLAALRDTGSDPGQHFWLTDRTDADTDQWAEKAGIQVIRYSPTPTHEVALEEVLADMRRFVSHDEPVPPGVPQDSPVTVAVLPPPEDLAHLSPEEIRTTLAAEAARILSDDSAAGHGAYASFRARYKRALHNAAFVDLTPPDNRLFGCRLSRQIGSGAFARVYAATDPSGEEVAIKLLRPEVALEEKMLGSFRRGIRSMRILTDRNVRNTVRYKTSYETPPCAVMDFVDGPNLESAIEDGVLVDLEDRLRVVHEASAAVLEGHRLPEQVLHRDLRPANIMLRGLFSDRDRWDVVVLDFDLSWHRGAQEVSIDLTDRSALGYLSPEQVRSVDGFSTRSAAVDTFGIGMTLFFALTGEHPRAGAAAESSWESQTRWRLRNSLATEWKSLPNRLARLIARATKVRQSERIDFAAFVEELDRLRKAHSDPSTIRSAQTWAEELVARGFVNEDYHWNADYRRAEVSRPSGLRIHVYGDDLGECVRLEADWASSGDLEWRKVAKYLPSRVDQFLSRLRTGGWVIESRGGGPGTFRAAARVRLELLVRDVNPAASALCAAAQCITL